MMGLCGRYAGICLACWLLAAASTAFAGMDSDGPYVRQWTGKDGVAGWVAQQGSELRSRSEPVAVGQSVMIEGVNQVPEFEVVLRAPAAPLPAQVLVAPDTPMLVVADTHGEYEILVELLRRQGVIGEELNWTFGSGHLAFLGDVFDRGAHQTEILWLIYKLEAEAVASGGAVHMLLGNHEALVLQGDARYLNPKYLITAEALGAGSYSELFAPATVLGQWLRSKPSIMKINGLLLVHGGVSPGVVGGRHSLESINQAVRNALSGVDTDEEGLARMMLGRTGPLWYRGYFSMHDQPAEATMADVDMALAHFGVERILVGHTAVAAITPLYAGKVLAVQVYPRRDAADGRMIAEAALLKDGAWYRADVSGTLLPILP